MLALIFFDFEAALKLIDLVASLSFGFFVFLYLIYQRYVVSDELLPILFELIDLVFKCGDQLRLMFMRLMFPPLDYILE